MPPIDARNGHRTATRVLVVQPSVPTYRVGLFERLHDRFGPDFQVYASTQDLDVLSIGKAVAAWEQRLGPIRQLSSGLEWQSGALGIPVRRGDVVVVSGAPRCLSNIALLIKARLAGATTIWWGHFWSSTSLRWRAEIRLLLTRLSNGILFYTDREIDEYRSWRPSDRNDLIFALNNGIETRAIVELRKPYDPQVRERDLLFIGRLTEKAGIDLLLTALTRDNCRSITLDVIGSGERLPQLVDRCKELGIADRVTWHRGIADENKIAEIANRCRLFVYPGAVGLSLIHAMSYGLPAIVHRDRWRHMPEIAAFTDGRNGASFEPDVAASLSRVIAETLADAARMTAMSQAAIETTAKSFNTEDMAERFCSMISRIKLAAP